MENEPLQETHSPDIQILLELLAEVRDDWNGAGMKLWIRQKLLERLGNE